MLFDRLVTKPPVTLVQFFWGFCEYSTIQKSIVLFSYSLNFIDTLHRTIMIILLYICSMLKRKPYYFYFIYIYIGGLCDNIHKRFFTKKEKPVNTFFYVLFCFQ